MRSPQRGYRVAPGSSPKARLSDRGLASVRRESEASQPVICKVDDPRDYSARAQGRPLRPFWKPGPLQERPPVRRRWL